MMFGWRFGSRMPAVYMKRYGKHIDDAQAIMNGVAPTRRQSVVARLPKKCLRCSMDNSPYSKFCNRCGCVLDAASAVRIDDAKRQAEELINKLASDPEKLKRLLAMVG